MANTVAYAKADLKCTLVCMLLCVFALCSVYATDTPSFKPARLKRSISQDRTTRNIDSKGGVNSLVSPRHRRRSGGTNIVFKKKKKERPLDTKVVIRKPSKKPPSRSRRFTFSVIKSDLAEVRKKRANTLEAAVPNPFPVEVLEELFQERKFIALTLERYKNHKIIKDFLSKDTLLLDICGEEFKNFHLGNKFSAKDYYYFFLSYFDQPKEERLLEFDGCAGKFTKVGAELYKAYAAKLADFEQEETTIDLDCRVADWLVYEMALHISCFLKDQLACSVQLPEGRNNPEGLFLPPASLFDSVRQFCHQPQFLENEFSRALEKRQYGRALQLQEYLTSKAEYNQETDTVILPPLQRAQQKLDSQVASGTLSPKQEGALRDKIAAEAIRQFKNYNQLALPLWLQHTKGQLQHWVLLREGNIKAGLQAAHRYRKENNLSNVWSHCAKVIGFLETIDDKEKFILLQELLPFFKQNSKESEYLRLQQIVLHQVAFFTADKFSKQNCHILSQAIYHLVEREQSLDLLKQGIFYEQRYQMSGKRKSHLCLAKMHGLAYQLSQNSEEKQYFLQQTMHHVNALFTLEGEQNNGFWVEVMEIVVPLGEYVYSIFLEKLHTLFPASEAMREILPNYDASEGIITARGCLQRALLLKEPALKKRLLELCISCCNQLSTLENFKDLEYTFVDAHTELALLEIDSGRGVKSLNTAIKSMENQSGKHNSLVFYKKYVTLLSLQWEVAQTGIDDHQAGAFIEEAYKKISHVYDTLPQIQLLDSNNSSREFCLAYVAEKLGHHTQERSKAAGFFLKSCQHYENAIDNMYSAPSIYEERSRAYSYYWLARLDKNQEFFKKAIKYFKGYLTNYKIEELKIKSEQEKIQCLLDCMRLEEAQLSWMVAAEKVDSRRLVQIQNYRNAIILLYEENKKFLAALVPFYSNIAHQFKKGMITSLWQDVNKIEDYKLLLYYCLKYSSMIIPDERWDSKIWTYLCEEEQVEQWRHANAMLPIALRQAFAADAGPQDMIWKLHLRPIFDAYQEILFCYQKLQKVSRKISTDSIQKIIKSFYSRSQEIIDHLSLEYQKYLRKKYYDISQYVFLPLIIRLDFLNIYLKKTVDELFLAERNAWLHREFGIAANLPAKMQALMFCWLYDEALTDANFSENLKNIWEQLKPEISKISASPQITGQYIQVLQAALQLFSRNVAKVTPELFEILDELIEKVTDNYWSQLNPQSAKTREFFIETWKYLHITDYLYQENTESTFVLFLESVMKFYIAHSNNKTQFDHGFACLLVKFVLANDWLQQQATNKHCARELFLKLIGHEKLPLYIQSQLCHLINLHIVDKKNKLEPKFSEVFDRPLEDTTVPYLYSRPPENLAELMLNKITANIWKYKDGNSFEFIDCIECFQRIKLLPELQNVRLQFVSVASISLAASQQRKDHDQTAVELLYLADLAHQIFLKDLLFPSVAGDDEATLNEDTDGISLVLDDSYKRELIGQYRLTHCTNPNLYFAPDAEIFQLFLNDGLQIYASLLMPVVKKPEKSRNTIDRLTPESSDYKPTDILPKFAQIFTQNQGQISDQTRALLEKVARIKSIEDHQRASINELLLQEDRG
ncbi:MAG: hypothetical protein ABFQ95_05515 [Pseudomonadota bacterium]